MTAIQLLTRVITRIASLHRQLAESRNLKGRLVCSALHLGYCCPTVDDLQQTANSSCGFCDRVLMPLPQQDQGIENLGITRAILRVIEIVRLPGSSEVGEHCWKFDLIFRHKLNGTGTLWSCFIQPIPTCRSLKQIFILRDLPDLHADGGRICLKFDCLYVAIRMQLRPGVNSRNRAKIEARHYINKLLAANKHRFARSV